MARSTLLFLNFISTFTLYLLIPTIVSRTTSIVSHTTAVLDVSSSIQQTFQVLSCDPTQYQKQLNKTTIPISSSHSLSLSIHPRSSMPKTKSHKDYKSLTLSRLARDSARVNSLNTKLHLALNPLDMANLKPVQTVLEPEDLQAPLTSGASQGSGEYFARIGVGQPAKSFSLVVDTGSDVSWLQCEPCSDCYQQSDPIFNPSESSSYSPFSCDSAQCSKLDESGCTDGTCRYQVSYGDGSFTVGNLVSETVSFGQSGSVRNVAIGCGQFNEGLFIGSAGLIGLGGGSLSLTSQIKATSFSYCLVHRDSRSSSTLEFNSAPPSDSIRAPLLRNSRIDTFFYVGLTGISVGGQLLSIPPEVFAFDQSGVGGTIVDSGTAITRLRTQAYNSLRDSFVKLTPNLAKSANGFSLFDTCYNLGTTGRVSVPTVSFHFGDGKTLLLGTKNYMIPVDSSGKFCLAFAGTEHSLSIIGNVQQQGTRVSYDLANKIVGFSPNKC